MDEPPEIAALIWRNVQTLMQRAYGGDNITRLGRESGIKTGGAQRLQHQADVGVRLIQRIAKHFKIDPWQLLAPNLGETMRLSPAELDAVRKLREPVQPKGQVIDLPKDGNQDRGGFRMTPEQKRRAAARQAATPRAKRKE